MSLDNFLANVFYISSHLYIKNVYAGRETGTRPPLEDYSTNTTDVRLSRSSLEDLVEQTEAHVVVRLVGLLLLLLLLLLGLGGWSSGGGSRGSTTGGSGTNSGSDVGDQVLDVDALQGLGEETGPVGLHLDVGGLQDGVDLLTLVNPKNKISTSCSSAKETIGPANCPILPADGRGFGGFASSPIAISKNLR